MNGLRLLSHLTCLLGLVKTDPDAFARLILLVCYVCHVKAGNQTTPRPFFSDGLDLVVFFADKY